MVPPDELPTDALRTDLPALLRRVASGEVVRLTSESHPVADLVPVDDRRSFLTPEEVRRIVPEAPLDANFSRDMAAVVKKPGDDL